ncbi:HNH endonuclease [Leekyejoonella antrihumi]|uniref:HNH endonuclease n=1 Tax=Leekyejoonella antrihumi TaxID=1660198 RepID=A0A563E9P3_9MICO|nr:HNH endonuclease [Leekyejoonella antrihumi]TWP38524.1 HNH endonuclease [Leekyejoonella antrihumi]
MGAYVFPTDTEWAAFLRARPDLDEVNFWLPSTVTFKALQAGERFLFKSKAKAGGRLIGGGLFSGHVTMRVSETWAIYGEGNGCDSPGQLLKRINLYRARNKQEPDPDPTIGCILLRDSFFVEPDDELPVPSTYPGSAVRGRGYSADNGEWSYIEEAFAQMLLSANVPILHPDSDAASFIDGPTRGEPRLFIPRVGQKGFKSLVLSSYHHRCAISGAKITPTLQAAHIRPVSEGGEHRVDNGMLLRSDVHILFDAGYLGIDDHHRLQVSPRLRSDFGNGDEFYSKSGEVIDLPDRKVDRPDKDATMWHMDTIFRAS